MPRTLTDWGALKDGAMRATQEIAAALVAISDRYDPDQWQAALAVYVGRSIRQARVEEGMPHRAATMLVECIREFALGD